MSKLSSIQELQNQLQALQAEQEEYKTQISKLKQQLAFYTALDDLLSKLLRSPDKPSFEMLSEINERAQAEVRRIVQEAEAERERILQEARLCAERLARESRPPEKPARGLAQTNDYCNGHSPLPMSQALRQTAGGAAKFAATELIIAGFTGFGQVIAFQKAVQGLPGVTQVKLRFVQNGVMSMELRHSPDADLASRLRELPGFALRLAEQSPGTIRFELQGEAANRSAPTP